MSNKSILGSCSLLILACSPSGLWNSPIACRALGLVQDLRQKLLRPFLFGIAEELSGCTFFN